MKKTTELYSSIENNPDQDEIFSFLCRQFVSSIFPIHYRDQIFTPDRLRLLRGQTLAHYIDHFDKFVEKLEAHNTFSLGLNPPPTADPPNVKPKTSLPTSGPKTPSLDKSHSRVASAKTVPAIPIQSLPCGTSCISCFLKGHVVEDCPTRNCGYCAVNSRPSGHFPKTCHHFDYITGTLRTPKGKAKSTRTRSTPPSTSVADDTSSLPELLDDSSSSEVSNLTVLFDSGSSEHIVPKQFLTQPSPLLPENRIEMESAFGEILSPTTVGSFKNLTPCYSLPVSDSDDALLSISRIVNMDKSILIDHSGLNIYENSSLVSSSLNNFKILSASDLILTAPEENGVYCLLEHQIPDFIPSKFRKRFVKTIQSYQTMNFKTLRELTEFFHRALGHPDLSTMLLMATSPSFTSWPKELTPSVIRKYFPSCSDCPLGNLAERPLPSSPKSNDIAIHSDCVVGEEFEIDLKGKYTAPDGKPVRSFDGSLYTFNGIDLASDYALLPSLPHRHNKTRRIERFHRSTSDLMMKQLANKVHLTPQYWSLSWQHAVNMRNILPRKRLLGKTPYEKWFGRPYDLVKHPTIPFGSVVFSHIPLDEQTALSGRSIEGVAVGPSFEHDFGLRIFNPLTKRESIRHSYRNMGEDEPTSTTYVLDFNNQPISLSSLNDSHVDNSSLSTPAPYSRSSSTPVVYHYNNLSLKRAPPETHSYFAHINKRFLDSATGVTYQIAGISEMSAAGFENEFVYQFYDTSLYSSCPLDPDSTEFEPRSQFLADLSYKFIDTPTRISRKTRRVNMVKTIRCQFSR